MCEKPTNIGDFIVDLTLPLSSTTPVQPGDPLISLSPAAGYEHEGYQVTRISLGSHAGTHMDAPRHFLPQGQALSDYPVHTFVSPGVILDLRSASSGAITPDVLQARLDLCPVEAGEYVLLWTDNTISPSGRILSKESPVPLEQTAVLSLAAASLLVSRGVTLVGIDTPSVDGDTGEKKRESHPVHRLLLSHGVLIAENLCNLQRLGEGRVQCIFLPLAVLDTDGAPIRAIAWRT